MNKTDTTTEPNPFPLLNPEKVHERLENKTGKEYVKEMNALAKEHQEKSSRFFYSNIISKDYF